MQDFLLLSHIFEFFSFLIQS